MVICLEQGADLHVAKLMPLPLTVSCFSKIQTGFTFLVTAHLSIPRQRAIKQLCVCVCVSWLVMVWSDVQGRTGEDVQGSSTQVSGAVDVAAAAEAPPPHGAE